MKILNFKKIRKVKKYGEEIEIEELNIPKVVTFALVVLFVFVLKGANKNTGGFQKQIKAQKVKKPQEQSIELKELIINMQRTFATKVSAIGNDRKGRIYIDYYNRDDLDRICELIEKLREKGTEEL